MSEILNLKVLFVTGQAENAVLNHGHLEQGMNVVTMPLAHGLIPVPQLQ